MFYEDNPSKPTTGTQVDRLKRYLGDGAYVTHDGHALVLTTEDGRRATNTVYLDPDVWAELVRYVDTLATRMAQAASEGEARRG